MKCLKNNLFPFGAHRLLLLSVECGGFIVAYGFGKVQAEKIAREIKTLMQNCISVWSVALPAYFER